MHEHVPPTWLVIALALFFWVVAFSALTFWILSLVWPGGASGLIMALGYGAGALFVTLHIPAAITGFLLWGWRKPAMPPRRRALHETATAYFGSAVAFGMLSNLTAMAVLDATL